MAVRHPTRITVATLALAVGLAGAAQAAPFNIFSASQASQASNGQAAVEEVRYGRRHHHRHGFNPGAAVAVGALGLIAGAAAASRYDRRYYCDPYYEYCGPPRYHRRYYRPQYYAPRYYGPRYYAPPPRRFYYYD